MPQREQRRQTITATVSVSNFARLKAWGAAYRTRPRPESKKTAGSGTKGVTQGDIVDLGLELISALGVNFGDGRSFSEIRKETVALVKNTTLASKT
jgi:hypothetical protein